MKIFQKVLRFIPAAFIISCSWYLSSLERIEQMPSFFGADKLVHCICFGILSFAVALSLYPFIQKKSSFIRILVPVLFIAVYGFIDELHQSYVPGRAADVFDWFADVTGAFLGSTVYFFLNKIIVRSSARETSPV